MRYDNTPRSRSFFRSTYTQDSTFSKIVDFFFTKFLPIVGAVVVLTLGILAFLSN